MTMDIQARGADDDLSPGGLYVHQYPRAGKAWWIVFALFSASVFAGLDRYILGLTVDSVKHDLHVSDLQISLLQGLAYSLFYATAGLMCGYVSDRTSRKWLLVFGLAVWTVATIAGGLAHGFWGLFGSRLLVGLGEATLIPVAVSTISDLFPPEKRGQPIGVYLLGQVLAAGLTDVVSGSILSTASHGGFAFLPLIGGLSGWRLVFIFCGLAGMAVVVLLCTIPDTPRTRSIEGRAHSFTAGETLGVLRRHWKIFTPLYLAYALGAITSYGLAAWLPMFFTRHFQLTPGKVGAMLGATFLIVGPGATLLGGVFTDRAARLSGVRGKTMLMVLLSLVMLTLVGAPFTRSPALAVVLVTVSKLAYPMISIAFLGVLQDLAPTSMRGLAVSICGLTNAVIGTTGGPMLIALATEQIYKNTALVGYSIATVCGPTLAGAAICYLICWRALPKSTKGEDQLIGLPLT